MEKTKFDLTRAMAGEPIVTRTGQPVKDVHLRPNEFTLGATVNGIMVLYDLDGRHTEDMDSSLDLFMASEPKKKDVIDGELNLPKDKNLSATYTLPSNNSNSPLDYDKRIGLPDNITLEKDRVASEPTVTAGEVKNQMRADYLASNPDLGVLTTSSSGNKETYEERIKREVGTFRLTDEAAKTICVASEVEEKPEQEDKDWYNSGFEHGYNHAKSESTPVGESQSDLWIEAAELFYEDGEGDMLPKLTELESKYKITRS